MEIAANFEHSMLCNALSNCAQNVKYKTMEGRTLDLSCTNLNDAYCIALSDTPQSCDVTKYKSLVQWQFFIMNAMKLRSKQ